MPISHRGRDTHRAPESAPSVRRSVAGVSAVLAAALVLVLAACGNNTSASAAAGQSSGSGGTVVKLSGFQFQPSTLTIKTGTKVTFQNADGTDHTVTNGKDGSPDANPLFDMPVSSGASVDFTFTTAGTFNVTCKIHHSMNMTITVQ